MNFHSHLDDGALGEAMPRHAQHMVSALASYGAGVGHRERARIAAEEAKRKAQSAARR